MTRQLQPCGTSAAYRRHKRDGETPCEPCTVARREYNRRHEAARRARTPRKPRVLAPCGTTSAYERHRRRGEQCAECARIKAEAAQARVEAAEARRAARQESRPPQRQKPGGGGPDGLILTWTVTPIPRHIARAAALTAARHVPAEDLGGVLDTLGITSTLRGAA